VDAVGGGVGRRISLIPDAKIPNFVKKEAHVHL
jgi:hypothetical protein